MTSIGGSQCAFCEQAKPLRLSHVIPSFVYRWLKETSATGYLRFGQKPNVRVQDGLKTELLCGDCEAQFNSWETPFASKLFHPYHQRVQTRFEYGDWMSRCLVSVCWRSLLHLQRQGHLRELSVDFRQDVDSALSTWKSFLQSERQDIGLHELHVLPLDEIADATVSDMPQRIHRYLLRAVQIDRVWTQQSAFVLVKLARLFVIGFIREPENARWEGTRIQLQPGVLEPGHFVVPDWLLTWIMQQAERISVIDESLSERQNEQIRATLDKNPGRVHRSETLAAVQADIRLSNGAHE